MKTKLSCFFIAILLCLNLFCTNIERNPKSVAKQFFYQVDVHDYAPMSIPDFFIALIDNHKKDYVQFSNKDYLDFVNNGI